MKMIEKKKRDKDDYTPNNSDNEKERNAWNIRNDDGGIESDENKKNNIEGDDNGNNLKGNKRDGEKK